MNEIIPERIAPDVNFETELGGLFDLKGKVAYWKRKARG